MRNFVRWTDEFFYHILEPAVREQDKVTPYIPGSPCGISHLNGHDKDNVGDTHLWAVWHGLQPMNYYRKRMTRFCSEFGLKVCRTSRPLKNTPSRRTIR
jgi:beta-mannosidase